MSISRYLDDLRAQGIYCFSGADAIQALGSGVIAVRAALRRLRHKGEIAMPFRGFYVIVPPEFRNLGCLPANHFIPSLMSHLEVPYYAGLLTAAEHHGAAHHRPQAFQVVVAQNRPGLTCGGVRVEFIARKNAEGIPTQDSKPRVVTSRYLPPKPPPSTWSAIPNMPAGWTIPPPFWQNSPNPWTHRS